MTTSTTSAIPVNPHRAQLLADAVIAGYIHDISGPDRGQQSRSARPGQARGESRIRPRQRGANSAGGRRRSGRL